MGLNLNRTLEVIYEMSTPYFQFERAHDEGRTLININEK